MITVASPQNFLYLFVLIPIVLLWLRGFARKRKALHALHQNYEGLLRDECTKICLIALALFFLTAALARPMLAGDAEGHEAHGKYLFLVDTSTSMAASKTPLSPNSLNHAKKIIEDTLKEFPDSCITIFLFSKLAFPVSSLTCDRSILQGVIDREIRVDRIPNKGTDIANALLVVGDKITDPSSIYHTVTHIIVLTDGGNEEFTAAEAQKIKASLPPSVQLTFMGVGDALGAPIPVFDGRGSFTGQYMQSKGSTYYARLQDGILKNMAAQLHGRYLSQDQEQVFLDSLRKEFSTHQTGIPYPVDLRFISFAVFTMLLFVLLRRHYF